MITISRRSDGGRDMHWRVGSAIAVGPDPTEPPDGWAAAARSATEERGWLAAARFVWWVR